MTNPVEALIAEYVACVRVYARTDYSDLDAVERLSGVTDRMREIAKEIADVGDDVTPTFAALLDNPTASLWAAHHLLEIFKVEGDIGVQALAIIEKAAEADGVTAIGEKAWLKEWRENQ